MIGHINGMAAHFRKMIKKPNIISHHCLAHKLELAFGHPMSEYKVFADLEADSNKLYAFFHNSDKRYALFDEYLISIGEQTFRFQKTFKVRLVSRQ